MKIFGSCRYWSFLCWFSVFLPTQLYIPESHPFHFLLLFVCSFCFCHASFCLVAKHSLISEHSQFCHSFFFLISSIFANISLSVYLSGMQIVLSLISQIVRTGVQFSVAFLWHAVELRSVQIQYKQLYYSLLYYVQNEINAKSFMLLLCLRDQKRTYHNWWLVLFSIVLKVIIWSTHSLCYSLCLMSQIWFLHRSGVFQNLWEKIQPLYHLSFS